MTNKYRPIIGMEIHAELKTKSKMFCSCKNDPFGADKPNIYTCPVCLGMPGALPVANKKAIEWTIKLGLALDCKINRFSKFDRKHYFYPDLPKGYQISQYDIPFCYQGQLKTQYSTVLINRIHLEEDTGKLLHKTIKGKKVSLIDFNRSSVPLIEIVTQPCLENADQAKAYAKKLRSIIRFLDIGDCDMEQGGMRLEANISLQKKNCKKLPNYKVEVKNINSFRFLHQAIEYEIQRQIKLLDKGITPDQETRGWNSAKSITFSQRKKETAADYRYFPDPDIPPVEFTKKEITKIQNSIPQLPDQIIINWSRKYNIEKKYAQRLCKTQVQSQKFNQLWEQAQKQNIKPNKIANLIINKKININAKDTAKQILTKYNKHINTDDINTDKLNQIIDKILNQNSNAVKKYKQGKTQIIGFLIGQVMKSTDKKLDAKLVRKKIIQRIES